MNTVFEAILALPPSSSSLRFLDPAVQAFCAAHKMDSARTNRLSFAVEAVVSYCFKVLRDRKENHMVNIMFHSDDPTLEVLIEYGSGRGDLEPFFRHGCRGKNFKLTSFEALGLYIARELVETVEFSSSMGQDNLFRLRITARD